MKPNDEPAFPISHSPNFPTEIIGGMTLRDYFAAKAMQSLIIEGTGFNSLDNQINPMCDAAYKWADRMLKARSA